MQRAGDKWALAALVLGMLAVGHVWLNGVLGPGGQSGSGPAVIGAAPAEAATVPTPGPGQKKVVLERLGMVCPLCKAAVSAKLGRVPGVIAYAVEVRSDSVTVLYDPARVTLDQLKEAIAEAGFQVRGIRELNE